MSAQTTDTLEKRRSRRRSALLARAELEGARWQFWVSTGAILVVGLLFASLTRWDAALLYTLATLAVFIVTNLINYLLVLRGARPSWVAFIIGTINILFLTYIIMAPNPFGQYELPPAMSLREAGFKYLLIFVCLGALTLSPRLASWLGVAAALSWAAAVTWVVTRPGVLTASSGSYADATLGERLRLYFNPHFVDVVDQATNIVVILIIAGIIASVVARTRNLAEDYTRAERARMNLARHFSPNMVDEIATQDEPFGPVRRQEIAVLFADIVGFTNFAEDHRAEDVFEMLREFHSRMEQVVFEQGGTVDNYIGDCIMATFGVPNPAQDDALRALSCAKAMQAVLSVWNRERGERGLVSVEARIGLHFGPVVLGAIGSERNLSFAVVGDTCNVASRLQALCKDIDASICAGAALVERIGASDPQGVLAGMSRVDDVRLRGRDAPIDVWILPRAEGAATA